MRKSVIEFVGLFLIGFIIVFLLGFSISGFAVDGTSSTSQSNFGNATPGVGDSGDPPLAAPDPTIDQIVNGDESSQNKESDFESTETNALDGFNFLSIEEYNSQNLSRFPWIPALIFFVFMVVVVLMILFFFVFSKHQSRSVVHVHKPSVPSISSSHVDSSSHVTSGSGLPLKATQNDSSSISSSVPSVKPSSSQLTTQSSQQQTQQLSVSSPQTASPSPAVTHTATVSHPSSTPPVSTPSIPQKQPVVSSQASNPVSSLVVPASHQPTASVQPSSQPALVQSSSPEPGTLSENLRYIKYYSHNMSKNPKVRIDYLIGQGKDFLRKGDVMSAKQIYSFISEEYKHLEVHDDAVYNAIVEFSSKLK